MLSHSWEEWFEVFLEKVFIIAFTGVIIAWDVITCSSVRLGEGDRVEWGWHGEPGVEGAIYSTSSAALWCICYRKVLQYMSLS